MAFNCEGKLFKKVEAITDNLDNLVSDRPRTYPQWMVWIDSLLVICIFTPATVLAWRGIWQLPDAYVYAEDWITSAWICLPIGIVINFVACFFQKYLYKLCSPLHYEGWRNAFAVVGCRVYTVVFASGVIMHWRGLWYLLDSVFPEGSWRSELVGVWVTTLTLTMSRTFRNTILSPPFTIDVDTYERYFKVQTMFHTVEKKNASTCVKCLDILYSVGVIGSLVIAYWRSVWTLMDILLFPEDRQMSAWGSTYFGFCIVIFMFAGQSTAKKFSASLSTGTSVLFEDIYNFLASIAEISYWRGIWVLADFYILPDAPAWSNALTALIGFVLLTLLWNGNSLITRGVEIDAQQDNGNGCVFRVYYTRTFFKSYSHRYISRQNTIDPDENLQDVEIGKLMINHVSDLGTGNGVFTIVPNHHNLNETEETNGTLTNNNCISQSKPRITEIVQNLPECKLETII